MMKENYSDKLVYKPKPMNDEEKPLEPTIGVKFSQNTVLLKSFLDQQKIEYKMEELEDTPLGLGIIIRKDDGM